MKGFPKAHTPKRHKKALLALLALLGIGTAHAADTIALSKSFTDDPVTPGGTVTLEFTLTNLSRTYPASNIAFSDDLNAVLPGLTANTILANDCGGTADITTPSLIDFSGGTLAAGGTCTLTASLQVPGTAADGLYTNVTSSATADINGLMVTANPANDDLIVAAAPILTKSFTDDPVAAGGAVTLEFTLTNLSASPLYNIAFSDDLGATLLGLTMSSANQMGICNGSGDISGSGTSTVTFANGSLNAAGSAGDSCTFSVTLQVPTGISAGSYLNTTSPVQGWPPGADFPNTGAAASDTLQVVAAPVLSKSFTDDPVVAGGTVNLEFTLTYSIENPPGSSASAIQFTDDLNATLSGLAATGLPINACGGQLSGTTNLSFTGGSLSNPGDTCTFSVPVQVPAGALPGGYTNTTSNVSATVAGLAVTGDPAIDLLEVAGLSLTKSFTDDPVLAGGQATLQFILTNLSPFAASAITFSDDLDAVLTGLTMSSADQTGICNGSGNISGSGTTTITFANGALAAAGSPGDACTFSVTLAVPLGTAGGEYLNTTSDVSGIVNTVQVTATGASDSLIVADPLAFSKTFTSSPVQPGGTVGLQFTITNASTVASATAMTFTDDLNAVLPGLATISVPPSPVCGGTSMLTGGSTLTLTGGELGPGASCTFTATLQIPAGAVPGDYLNTTSALSSSLGTTAAAQANLAVNVPPGFSKSFAPNLVIVGTTSTLTFTIDNTGNPLTVFNLAFTDNLPAGMVVATPPNATNTCGGGTLTAPGGASAISYSGGAVTGSGSCTIQVDVTATMAGNLVNTTGNLTSDAGTSGTATDTLVVNGPPGFSKAFTPGEIAPGDVGTLTFTIDNSAGTDAVDTLDFTDTMPAAIVVASPANASTTCSGGTLTAVPGSNVISYTGGTVAASSICAIQVDVTSNTSGTHLNTTGDLTSTAGDSGPASAQLRVTLQTFPIPTLRDWGLLLLALSLMAMAWWILRGRQRSAYRSTE